MYPYSVTEPPYCPTFSNSFLSTKLDLFLIVEAAQAGLLPLYPRRPEPWESLVLNGSIVAYVHDASEKLGDWDCWTLVDEDGIFEVSQSTDSRQLMRKKASVWVGDKLLVIFSHYRQWDTTNGKLVPPSRCLYFQAIRLRNIFTSQGDLRSYSPIEAFRFKMEVWHQT